MFEDLQSIMIYVSSVYVDFLFQSLPGAQQRVHRPCQTSGGSRRRGAMPQAPKQPWKTSPLAMTATAATMLLMLGAPRVLPRPHERIHW